jgi:hypothetical protein
MTPATPHEGLAWINSPQTAAHHTDDCNGVRDRSAFKVHEHPHESRILEVESGRGECECHGNCEE